MKLKLLVWMVLLLMLSGCAGTGFNKKATLMPDQIKMEIDASPERDWRIYEVTGGASWNLK